MCTFREASKKLAVENATKETNQLKEETKGIFGATCVCFMVLIEYHMT